MNMEIDRDSLSERLFKHEGFLYKIEDDGEDIYYFLGYYVFCTCDCKTTTVHSYNEMIDAIKSNNKDEICKQFRKITSRSHSRKQYNKDTRKKFNDFIMNLNDKQFEDLKKQVQQFEDLWGLYRLK